MNKRKGRALGPSRGEAAADRRSRLAERTEETREALIAAARKLFAAKGYAGVGTEEIVRAARVTRGALYHHFANKQDLFRVVYERVEQELMERVGAAAGTADGPIGELRAGARAFLEACEDPAVQRIALLDAPSVLGWEQWREIGMRYAFGMVEAVLQAAIDAGTIEPQPVRPLSHLVLGAVDEAAMLVARADDGGQTRRAVTAAMDRYLEALSRPR